jgi:cytoskeletal protein CcmA (bactofilin family)
VLAVSLLAAAAPARALELRRDAELVAVAAGERIDDTLIAVSRSITVAGTINGDLIAVGRRVIVRGIVNGDLITGAETISLQGIVRGNVIGLGATLETPDSLVGRNLYGLAWQVSTSVNTEVDGNVTVLADTARVGGTVGTDVTVLGDAVEIGADVKGGVDAFADTVTLLDSARVGGDLTARVPTEASLTVLPGAEVTGATQTRLGGRFGRENRYASGAFYARQALRFVAAFIVGLALFLLFPALPSTALGSGLDVLKTGGIGLVALVSLPAIAVLAMITIVGLPIGIIGLLSWLIALYLAKIVLAGVVGTAALGGGRHVAPTLAAGLAVVLVLVNLPYAGRPLGFVLTVLGLGLLTRQIWRHFTPAPGGTRAAA